ncbi:hypothetical protein AUP68_08267 [Ilyonectria robusta]
MNGGKFVSEEVGGASTHSLFHDPFTTTRNHSQHLVTLVFPRPPDDCSFTLSPAISPRLGSVPLRARMEVDSMPTETEFASPNDSRTPSSHQQKASSRPNQNLKGRVRTGCLVCRARKVKCDEQRPTCQKCTRLKKACVYRIATRWGLSQSPPMGSDLLPRHFQRDQTSTGAVPNNVPMQAEAGDYPILTQPGLPGTVSDLGAREILTISGDLGQADLGLSVSNDSDESSPNHGADNFDRGSSLSVAVNPSDRFQQTSQLIYLSTTMDWLAASEAPSPSSFSYFIEVVECPLLSPFDHLNWTRIRQHIARLGFQHTSVAGSLLAVQALYRAQVDRLPMAYAMSVYQAAVTGFESTSGDEAVDFDIVLVSAFLLCLCAVSLPNEDGPHLAVFDGAFVVRLEAWLLNGHRSPVSLRICAWLQLLNTTTKRPGSAGLLSASVLSLLYNHVKEVPGLSTLDCDTHPERCLYDAVATPIFTFYLRLQTMSNRVADVTHYRRSRTTPADQAEVTDIVAALKIELSYLWEKRPATLQLQPDKVREHLSAQISDPLIALAGVCIAAFHAEIIVIGRILGDPPFPSPEAKHALEQIRSIVQGGWNVSADGALNPGYIRPLFVYALESFQKDESQWAADQLRRIKHPSSRSNFLASFVEAHGEAQRAQGRRVTMKYFCYQTFGVALPFM